MGKTDSTGIFNGQIIDTININSGQAEKGITFQTYKINICGKVLYNNGSPYQNGTIELKSKVRYTKTNEYGQFEFIDVEDGSHTISILENGVVLTATTFIIEKTNTYSSAQIAKLADGSYLILSPTDIQVINLVLKLDKDKTKFELSIEQENNSGSLIDSSGSETPDETDGSEASEKSKEPDAPVEPGAPADPKKPGAKDPAGGIIMPDNKPPEITVYDDLDPSQVWTQLTSVDIFAERAGNIGVQTIDQTNVIAPGATGKYIFKIKNTEKFSILYLVSLSETDQNDPALPMKYRIKVGVAGDDYIGGNAWKKAENTMIKDVSLAPGKIVFYTLEWKWDTDDDLMDTLIGMQEKNPNYILDIIINAQSQ